MLKFYVTILNNNKETRIYLNRTQIHNAFFQNIYFDYIKKKKKKRDKIEMIIVHQIFYPKQEFMIPNQGIKQSHLFMLKKKIKNGVIKNNIYWVKI